MAVIIFGSLFVSLRPATAINAESMWMDPEFKTVDPTPTQMTFLYDLWINTTYSITAWQAKLLFDPAVIRAIDVNWGAYINPTNVSSYYSIPGTGESILLGQAATNASLYTGPGLLASVNFTFVLPGACEVKFLEAKVFDSSFVEYDLIGGAVSGKLDSNMPHPTFTWSTDDGLNPLPDHTFSDGGDDFRHYDVVHFDASASYDVENLVWDLGTTSWIPGAGYPDIIEYLWDFGDGKTSNDVRTQVHGAYANGSVVRLGDTDIGTPLTTFLANETYIDWDDSSDFSIGDAIVQENVTDGVFNATMGDLLIHGTAYDGNATNDFTLYEKHEDSGATATFWDVGEEIYLDMQNEFGTGYCTVSIGVATMDHVYTAYEFDGYLVNLTVRDSEDSYWSTTWRYGGPHDDDTVPCWRDVAVVDFWPSLMPFEVWDNGTGADWWAWWWYDTVDYTIPRVDSYYWNYEADNIFGAGTHASDWGLDFLMTFANYGSVPEYCKTTLYALKLIEDIGTIPEGFPANTSILKTGVTMVAQYSFTIGAGSGSGWYWALAAPFLPAENGYYLMIATIDLEGAMHDDQNPGNNYMAGPQVVSTIYNFGSIYGTDFMPWDTFARYKCDLDGSGKVDGFDWAIFSKHFGGNPTLAPPPRP
jgi:hypothetical protein